ncbi:MAG: response regulator [Anaerolineae bacterium]|nr:response regulator [Anaerolineae bacterium]
MTTYHALVIDDNLPNLKILAQLLHKQGLRTTEVHHPGELAALLPALEPVDLVFLDLEMPGLHGYVVKDLLRAHFDSVRIIAYTVHTSEINQARALGFDGFLGKPLDIARFPDQLARILKGEPVWERV